jgi:hypothetical protein
MLWRLCCEEIADHAACCGGDGTAADHVHVCGPIRGKGICCIVLKGERELDR